LEWTWDTEGAVSGPLIGMAKQFAHQNGLDNAQFQKMMSLFASYQLNEQKAFRDAQQLELAKLGATAPTRVDSVVTWLRATVGDKLAESLRRSLFTADQIHGLEKLMSKYVSGGVGGSPGAARTGGEHGHEPARLTDDQYARLTYHEKIQYSQQFRQN
jgi:hypothetical protein